MLLIGFSLSCNSARAQGATNAGNSPAASDPNDAKAARAPVVVELFTSEGCDSCPPADKVLGYIVEKQPFPGTTVIALEEHVDYWNHEGWNDPYSSPRWTDRQQSYAGIFKKGDYTPQMVVNGRAELVGSDGPNVVRTIQSAAHELRTEVTIAAGTLDPKGVRQYTITTGKLSGNPGDTAEIWLAVTEDGLQSSVNAGENSGKTLQHASTLHSLQKVGVADPNKSPASFTGDAQVKFDPRWNAANTHIVVFIQEKKGREILGASSIAAAN